MLTQIHRDTGRIEPTSYVTSRPVYEKLKILTNMSPAANPTLPQAKSRNDRSQDHSTLNISSFASPQGSVMRGERGL